MLLRGGGGFGALALSGMLARDKAFAAAEPMALGQAQFAPKAKNVIFLFMEGGPSHIDLFDPKPLLNKLSGQRMPESFKRPITAMGEAESPATRQPPKVEAPRPKRHLGERLAAAYGRVCR